MIDPSSNSLIYKIDINIFKSVIACSLYCILLRLFNS
jgi:hypothetical protein